MSSVVGMLRAQPLVLALIALGVAGCSSETSRFNDNPFASRPAPDTTGSVQGAPSGRIEQSQLPPPTGSVQQQALANPGTAGGGRGMASYQPAVTTPSDVTGSVRKPAAPSGHWTWDGGIPVTVAPGDTVDGIARRHNVPASAIIQSNNLAGGAIQPGQRLVIPRYVTGTHMATAPSRPITASGTNGLHVVGPGDTLSKLSRLYGKPVTEIARANSIEPHATLKIGERIVIPGATTAQPKPALPKVAQAKPLGVPKAQPPVQKQQPVTQKQQQPAEQTPQTASLATNETPNPTGAVKTSEGAPTFRWPVKGRVLAGYGPKPNGQQNDGINVSVPEGTPVKAAEGGVVAYAGNELKGYGNLVLVRHPNGYVTAYAHAKELMVKRGDQIKRGQVIATSGQTGNVDAPQLHFEVRKGPTPVDPMPMLSGG